MNVPLMVIERSRGLTIVRNGELMEIPFPENPYVLCQSSISTNNQKEYTDIYTKEKILLGREEFEDLNDARDFYMAAGRRGVYFNSIKDQILLDKPDYFRQFGQTEPVKILRVDIECLSDGSGVFPKPGKVPIIAISIGKRSWPAPAEEPICLMNYQDGEIQDKRILEEFVKIYKDYNPDIVLGYNPWFDIEYIIGRLQKHKMSLSFLTRDGSLPFFQTKEGMRFRLSGRIVMDLYESVKRDQSLSGIKDKKLKTVCAWYKIPAISLDTKDLRPYVNTPQLMEYNISDVRVLDKLTDIYLPLEVQLAEMMGMPLDDVINGFNSSIPKIYTGRRLLAMGFIPLDSNEDRYGDTRFEAAYVDILKTGRFDAIYKLDFASQYPSVMMTFNLGPDTVKMINQEAYDPAKFSVERREDTLHLVIPDENFQKNMIITVDLSKDSFIREDMLRLYKMRVEIKKELKGNVQGTERIALESKSNALKVLMNTCFGFFGLKYSRFGDMATAVAIVGLSRWLIHSSIDKIKNTVVEADSVPGYVPIYVQKNGLLDIIPIQDLHENTNELRLPGTKDYKVLSRDGWTDILYTKCHRTNKNIHRVTVSDGVIDVTEDHSLFDNFGNELKSSDIERNDEILIKENPLPGKCDSISPELAWAFGLFLAEGSISKQRVYKEQKRKTWKSGCKFNISISMQNNEALTKAKNIFEKELWERLGPVCNRYPKLKIYDTMKSSATYRLEGFYNQKYYEFFLNTCYSLDGKTKKVPIEILNSTSEDVLSSFIDGAMLGDGYIAKLNGRKQWCYTSHDWPLAAGFQYIMHRLGHLTRTSGRYDKPMVLSIRKRFPYYVRGYKEIKLGRVLSNKVMNNHDKYVYDISTKDGSFTSAIGNIVLHNTDGLYLDADVNLEEMNTFIAGLVAEKTGQQCYLKFEKEGPWIGYFYKSKNYALLKGNDIIFHGVAFKSSKYGKIRDRFVNEVARATLMGANDTAVKELVIRLRDLSSYSLEDFMMHISLTKTHYETGSQQDKLIKKIEPILQRKVVAGESIDYYKVPEGYEVSENITTIDQLDKDYYLGVIEKAQEIFGLQDVHKTPEELLEEARKEKKLILMRKKRDLKDYFEGNIMAHPEFGNLSIEAARLEFSRIEDIQECMTKKWPCPACSGLERELRYPEGIECKCGWIGLPPRPPRKTRKKRTDDTRK